ncbi:MAG: helix-turn-helix domain-containing protein [Lactococcus sp.]
MSQKKIINSRYGQAFRAIREEQNLSLDDFKKVISRASLSRFELGEASLSTDKLEEVLSIMHLSIFTFLFLADNIPVYRRYGEVFQLLREQREFERESFENIDLSQWTLKKFEEGKVMLDFAQVESALQMMHIPLYEYTYLLDKGEADYFGELYKRVDTAFLTEDWTLLRKIYEESIPYDDFRMLALATKACYEALDENEIQEVADFLFGVDVWTNLELFVFNYTVGQLSFNLIRSIWIDFFKNVTYFEDNREYRIRIVRTMAATCLVMLERERANDAQSFLTYAQAFLQSTDEFTRCLFKFTQALVNYAQTKDTQALEEMKKVIGIFDYLGDAILAEKYRRIMVKYTTILKK